MVTCKEKQYITLVHTGLHCGAEKLLLCGRQVDVAAWPKIGAPKAIKYRLYLHRLEKGRGREF